MNRPKHPDKYHATVSLYRDDDNEIQVNGIIYPGEPEVRYGRNACPSSPPYAEIESAYDEAGNEIGLTSEEEADAKQQMLEKFDPTDYDNEQ